MRDDSRRNRESVRQAAAASLATGAPDDVHAEIARRTGLGRSTVYRHAGDRQDVAGSVVADQLGVLRAAAREVAAGRSSIRALLGLILSTQVAMHPLVRIAFELPERDQDRILGTILATVTPAFEQARAAGRVRADAHPHDLAAVLRMLVAGAEHAAGDARQLRLLVDVLLDGLLTDRGEPGPPASG